MTLFEDLAILFLMVTIVLALRHLHPKQPVVAIDVQITEVK